MKISMAKLIALIKALGGGGSVTDVQVDGQSVVTDGVANITVPSGGGVLVVHATDSGTVITLDKTFKQIEDGMTSGGVVIVKELEASVSTNPVTGTYKMSFESGVYVIFKVYGGDTTFSADSEDGYPYYEPGR